MADEFLIKLVFFVSSRYGWLLSFLVLSTSSVCNSEICKKLTKHEILSALEDLSELFEPTSETIEPSTTPAPSSLFTNTANFSNCRDVAQAGFNKSEIFQITVPGKPENIQVYCDLETDDGGWLVFQRRMDGSVDFYRNWTEYERGFGNLSGEFWLGLDLLHAITSSNSYQLRVDLEDWEGNTSYATYRNFSVGNSQSNYTLNVQGYNGSAGDSLSYNNNSQFSTKDRDNDETSGNCAEQLQGAFWYGRCGAYVNLNGEYLKNGENRLIGVWWYYWKLFYSLKRVEMKIKPN